MLPKVRAWLARIRTLLALPLWRIVGKPIVATSVGVVLTLVFDVRVSKFWAGPEYYKIYVVGPVGNEGEIKHVFAPSTSEPTLNRRIDGKFVKIETPDDKAGPDTAAQIAKELVAKEDTLMVIGHVFSTQTKAGLPHYLAAKPRIPVILMTETNPGQA